MSQNLKSKVFFLHVPKCGGTSVKDAIFDRLGVLDYLRGRYFLLNAHTSREAADALGVKMRDLREKVLAYKINCSPRPIFVSGHFIYSSLVHKKISEEYTFTTVIRKPVSRFLSHFLYNKKKQKQEHFGIDMNIDEYLASERAEGAGKLMTSYFAGNEALNDDASTADGLVERAIQNIRCFDVVGVLGDLKRFEQEFARATGTNIQIPHHRKNPADQSERENILTEERLERIRELCAPDIQLFEAVLDDLEAGG